MDIEHLSLCGVEGFVRQSDELLVINVVVSKPKFRRQREFQRLWPAQASKRLRKLLLTRRTTT